MCIYNQESNTLSFNEKEAKSFIENFSQLYEALTGEAFKLYSKGKNSPELRLIFWSWLLSNPDKAPNEFFTYLEKEIEEYNKIKTLIQEKEESKRNLRSKKVKLSQNNHSNVNSRQEIEGDKLQIGQEIKDIETEINNYSIIIKNKFYEEKEKFLPSDLSYLYDLRAKLSKSLEILRNIWFETDCQLHGENLVANNPNISRINAESEVLIMAARKLQSIVALSKSQVFEFYTSKEWRNYIRERCGKLSVLGFSKNDYPLTEDFYVEPDFDNSENWDNLKNSISNPKARILITGQSGIGKTSLLKRMAMLCYRQEICKGYLPVYISLRQASFLENEFSPQSLWDIYMSNLSDMGVKIPREKMIEVFLEGKALILIDGLDFNHVNSWNHITQVRNFIQTFPNNSFVISSKELPSFVSDSLADKIFNIKGFDKELSQEFIQKYFKIKGKDLSDEKIRNLLKKYSDLLSSSDIRDCQDYIPLLLSCFCWEMLQNENENSSNNSHRRDDIINDELIPRVIDQLVKHWDDDRSSALNDPYRILLPEQRIQLLGFLAVRFMEGVNKKGNRASVTVTKNESINWIIEFIITPEITKYYLDNLNILSLGNSENIQQIALYLLNSIESQDGLIVERNPHVSFIHGSIQRYLAAKYLSNCALKEMDKYLELQGDWISVVKQALQLINADFIQYSARLTQL